ncbi:GFA family protein [Sneathiella aquimaris]|uniref:GFA family protein n=1 Tax=Sneathiella aquimaris TaxID=2599305 RepID=UPI001C67768A|nr:GFA family protein [Sneathiella aquimaris]
MSQGQKTKTGACMCGAVTFRVTGPFRDLIMCHCNQCQRASGHHIAATAAPIENFEFSQDQGLRWFQSSSHAKRGFCEKCGSSLFWQMAGNKDRSIFVGCLDGDVDLPVSMHVFAKGRKSYYSLEQDVPVYDYYPGADNEG